MLRPPETFGPSLSFGPPTDNGGDAPASRRIQAYGASDALTLPIFKSLHYARTLAVVVIRRHWQWLGLAWALLVFLTFASVSLGWLIAELAIVAVLGATAVLTQREILRGPTTVEEAVDGPDGWQLVEFLTDALIVGLTIIPFALAGIYLIVHYVEGAAVLLIVAAALVAWLPLAARLWLKLPARAVGDRLGWIDAWRLSRGKALAMAAAAALLHAAFAFIAFAAWVVLEMAGAGALARTIVMTLPALLDTLLATALLSAFYLELTAASG